MSGIGVQTGCSAIRFQAGMQVELSARIPSFLRRVLANLVRDLPAPSDQHIAI